MLRMRRKWLKDKVQMVAPIEEVVSGEMEIDDDGEGAEDARMEPRADEPGDVPPPPRPREVRPSAIRPGAEIVRLAQFDTLSISELVRSVWGIKR